MRTGLLVVCSLLLSSLAFAQVRKRDSTEESRYAESLKRADPVLAEVFAKATTDLDAQRWDESRAGFERILAAVPEHAPSMRRLAFVFDQQKRTSDAIAWARKAAKDTSDVLNQTILAELLSKQSDPDLRSEAMDLARSAYNKEANEENTLMLAQTAIRTGQLAPLREATTSLEQLSSKEPAAKFFLAIGYAAQGEWSRADAALDQAVQLGLPAEAAADPRSKLGIEDRLATWRYVKIAGIVLAAWILGLGLIYFVGRFLSRRILQTSYPEPAPSADADDEAWSLFPNREFLEADFTGKINDQLRDQGVLDTPMSQWGQTGPLAT